MSGFRRHHRDEITLACKLLDGVAHEGHLLTFLLAIRREKLFWELTQAISLESSGFSDFQKLHAANLVNPVLIPSLIGMAVNDIGEGPRFLQMFVNAEPMNGFEEYFANIRIDSFPPEELDQFLLTEDRYHIALNSLLLDDPSNYLFDQPAAFLSFRYSRQFPHWMRRPLASKLAFDGYTKSGIKRCRVPQHGQPGVNANTLRFSAWFVSNPLLSDYPLIDRGDSVAQGPNLYEVGVLMGYVHDKNSLWHNIYEQVAFDFEVAKRALNAKADEKVIQRYELCEKLLSRAERFYWWNPDEASANDFGDQTEAILEKVMKETENPGERI